MVGAIGVTAPVRAATAAYAPAGSTVHGEENPGLVGNGCSALPGKTHQLGFPISLFPRSHPSDVFGPELLFLTRGRNYSLSAKSSSPRMHCANQGAALFVAGCNARSGLYRGEPGDRHLHDF